MNKILLGSEEKKMTKRNSLICFILSIVLIAGLCFVSMFGVDKNGKGSAKNITLGLDLNGGVSVTYLAIGDVS